ncbi:MAG TPA: hypothetical protein VFB99_22880 [Vicinamibacterales bacterium]|nr:hypothetical protein [Vicinamibacterales bacterium]
MRLIWFVVRLDDEHEIFDRDDLEPLALAHGARAARPPALAVSAHGSFVIEGLESRCERVAQLFDAAHDRSSPRAHREPNDAEQHERRRCSDADQEWRRDPIPR